MKYRYKSLRDWKEGVLDQTLKMQSYFQNPMIRNLFEGENKTIPT